MLKPPRAKFSPMFLSPPNRQRKISHSPIKQHFFENLFPSDKMGWEEKILFFYDADHIKTVFDFLKYLVLMVLLLCFLTDGMVSYLFSNLSKG